MGVGVGTGDGCGTGSLGFSGLPGSGSGVGLVGVPGVLGVGSTGTFCADTPRKPREARAEETTKTRKRNGAFMMMASAAHVPLVKFLQMQGDRWSPAFLIVAQCNPGDACALRQSSPAPPTHPQIGGSNIWLDQDDPADAAR